MNAYKGFVRPVLEYSVLTWMGAAESNLNKLDQVQARALRTCDKKVSIDSLCHGRKVSAASYLFKLKFMDPPELLRDLVPDDAKPSARPARTRRAKEIELHGHKYQLNNHCNIKSLDGFKRAFPNCIIDCWNKVESGTFDGNFDQKHLQHFKQSVNRMLR